jgi:hypothetical protein
LQRGGGEARRVALLTDHDDLQPVVGNGQPRVAAGIETPLQDIALDDEGSGHEALRLTLCCGPDVDYDGTRPPRLLGLLRSESYEPSPGRFEHLVNGPWSAGRLRVRPLSSDHQLTPTS